MRTMTYKVGDLKALIRESSNEFKARLGTGVESGNKSNNEKAYRDAGERAKSYDGGLASAYTVTKYEKTGDDNRTPLDYDVDNVDDAYKKRVAAQAQGYTSEAERDNKIEKLGDYDDNKYIFSGITKSADEWKDDREVIKRGGLTARTTPDDTFKHDSLYESADGLEMRRMMDRFKAARRAPSRLNESADPSFYSETDSEGKTGEPGMVKSYDCGYMTTDSIKKEAEEHGQSVEDFLKTWWDEAGPECPFTWQETKDTYGYNGDTILRIGDVVFKDIYGQMMVDEYEPGYNDYSDDFEGRVADAQMSSADADALMESNSVKTAYFKRTVFLSEGHMASRIPDEFKTEGNRFKMTDKTGNQYLMEWREGKGVILAHKNKNGLNESVDRMRKLFNYDSQSHAKGTSASGRLNESGEAFKDTLDKARKIIK